MKQKMVKVPFDIELAKKITNGEIEGRVITEDGRPVKIVYFSDNSTNAFCVLYVVNAGEDGECSYWTKENGSSEEETADLILEIPEYMTFKDGDIVKLSNDTYTWLSIIKDIDLSDDGKGGLLYFTNDYVSMLINDGDGSIDIDTYSDAGQKVERATEEEKQKLIDAMKANEIPKAKEYLKRFFGIEEKPKYEFKPFDKVLVRNFDDNKWSADIFSHMDGDIHECVAGIWTFCIPYNDQTAHLIGTTEDYNG